MNLAIGTKVRWESAAGVKRGTIKNIVLAPAANDKVTPWIDVEYLVQISDMYQLRSEVYVFVPVTATSKACVSHLLYKNNTQKVVDR